MGKRTETDSLGDFAVPADALYGIHTARALVNFSLTVRLCAPSLVRGMALVKLACAQTNTALGYLENDVGVAKEAQRDTRTIREVVLACSLLAPQVLDRLLSADAMTALGYGKLNLKD